MWLKIPLILASASHSRGKPGLDVRFETFLYTEPSEIFAKACWP